MDSDKFLLNSIFSRIYIIKSFLPNIFHQRFKIIIKSAYHFYPNIFRQKGYMHMDIINQKSHYFIK